MTSESLTLEIIQGKKTHNLITHLVINSVSRSSSVYLIKAVFVVFPTKTVFFPVVQESEPRSGGSGAAVGRAVLDNGEQAGGRPVLLGKPPGERGRGKGGDERRRGLEAQAGPLTMGRSLEPAAC